MGNAMTVNETYEALLASPCCRRSLGEYVPFHLPGDRDRDLFGDDVAEVFSGSLVRSVCSMRGESWTIVCAQAINHRHDIKL